MKDGKKIVLGEEQRKGNGRTVHWKKESGKLYFEEGGVRRFSDREKARQWANDHGFNFVEEA
jgi:hypothetical protein